MRGSGGAGTGSVSDRGLGRSSASVYASDLYDEDLHGADSLSDVTPSLSRRTQLWAVQITPDEHRILSLAELHSAWLSGLISGGELCRRAGAVDWVPLREVVELRERFERAGSLSEFGEESPLPPSRVLFPPQAPNGTFVATRPGTPGRSIPLPPARERVSSIPESVRGGTMRPQMLSQPPAHIRTRKAELMATAILGTAGLVVVAWAVFAHGPRPEAPLVKATAAEVPTAEPHLEVARAPSQPSPSASSRAVNQRAAPFPVVPTRSSTQTERQRKPLRPSVPARQLSRPQRSDNPYD